MATMAWSSGRPSRAAAVGLGGGEERGQHAAEALVAGRQQDVVHERVDRGPADHREAVEVAVDHGQDPQVDGDHQHLGHRLDGVSMGWAGRPSGIGRSAGAGSIGAEGPVARRLLGQVAAPHRGAQVGQPPPQGRVPHHRDVPALLVAAARGEAGVVEDRGAAPRAAPARR